jgi:hypothetical protein
MQNIWTRSHPTRRAAIPAKYGAPLKSKKIIAKVLFYLILLT